MLCELCEHGNCTLYESYSLLEECRRARVMYMAQNTKLFLNFTVK